LGRLKRTLVRLLRCRHSRGFGIQSPWAYALVCNVINEHLPYYAYQEKALCDAMEGWPREKQRLAWLYFRLANMRRPLTIHDNKGAASPYAPFYKAGCNRSKVADAQEIQTAERVEFVRLDAQPDNKEALQTVVQKADGNSILVLEGINESRDSREMWRELVADERGINTFDLYDCGIIFFDRKRYKEDYIINF